MSGSIKIRIIGFSREFKDFYDNANQKVKNKIDYVLQIISTQKVVNEKFVKKLQNTEFYEMRISVGTNEYRSILLAIDHDSLMEATKILALNSFLKKGNNDYNKAIEKARNILNHKNNTDNGNNE